MPAGPLSDAAPASFAGSLRTCPTKGAGEVKFTVDRDVLADAVTWTARTLPNRPSIPVLAGVRIEASTEGTLSLSKLRLRDLSGFSGRGRCRGEWLAARLRSSARGDLTIPARQAGRDRRRGLASRADLWIEPFHAADDAARGLPGPPRDAPGLRHDRCARVRRGGVPGDGRRQPGRDPAAPHRRPCRGRRRDHHVPRHRPVPARCP